MASSATANGTPSISNRIRPGRITVTHCSGAPLPFPMPVSAGFFVIGLSGKTRIQTLPPRLMKRVIATRAASIWRSVTQAHRVALSPKSPKASWEPVQALPFMRPRCCFLYLTFFGINMAFYLRAILLGGPAGRGLVRSGSGLRLRDGCFRAIRLGFFHFLLPRRLRRRQRWDHGARRGPRRLRQFTWRCLYSRTGRLGRRSSLYRRRRPALASVTRRGTPRFRLSQQRSWPHLALEDLSPVNPGFDTDHAIRRISLRETVVDVRPQRVQGQLALQVPFAPGDFRAVQPSRDADFDALAAEAQGGIDGFPHRTAERNALLELEGDRFGHKLSVQLGLMDLLDVDKDIALGPLRQFQLELLDLGAFASDDDPRPRRADRDPQLVAGPVDFDRTDARRLQPA